MQVLAAPPIALKLMLKEISLLNFGISQGMTGTKIADLFSIRKLMVSASVLTCQKTFFFFASKTGPLHACCLVVTELCQSIFYFLFS